MPLMEIVGWDEIPAFFQPLMLGLHRSLRDCSHCGMKTIAQQ
jgi:hypothetical protein